MYCMVHQWQIITPSSLQLSRRHFWRRLSSCQQKERDHKQQYPFQCSRWQCAPCCLYVNPHEEDTTTDLVDLWTNCRYYLLLLNNSSPGIPHSYSKLCCIKGKLYVPNSLQPLSLISGDFIINTTLPQSSIFYFAMTAKVIFALAVDFEHWN